MPAEEVPADLAHWREVTGVGKVGDEQERLKAWAAAAGVHPEVAGDERLPPDPVTLDQVAAHEGVARITLAKRAEQQGWPAPRILRARRAPGTGRGRGPDVYRLAEVEAAAPRSMPTVDPYRFGADELISISAFMERAGITTSLYQYQDDPEFPQVAEVGGPSGGVRYYSALELAAFVNARPGRRGKPGPRKAGGAEG